MLSIPRNSKFDQTIAIELANLVERAYQDYKNAINKAPTIQVNGTTTGSQKIIPLSKDGNSEHVEALPGDLTYKILAVFHELMGAKNYTPIGFIAERNGNYYVIFRGTMEKNEWRQDTKSEQISFDIKSQGLTGLGRVAKGFWEIYTEDDNTRDDFLPLATIVKNHLALLPPNTPIFVAGHSLGGALAALAARHLLAFGLRPTLYTFASPRAGNPDFAKAFTQIESYRVANSEDIVPYLAFATLNVFGSEMQPNRFVKDRIEGLLRFASLLDLAGAHDEYVHVGEPIYFTKNLGAISMNHNMYDVYRGALA